MTKIRVLYIIGFSFVCLILGLSYYLQIFSGFNPCPLCIFQRFVFVFLGIIFLIGILTYRKMMSRLATDILLALISVAGILLAGRQVWIQQFPPPSSAECGVSLQYMLQALPLGEVLKKVFSGTAECTQPGWEFLHLNMAEWSLIWFIIFFLFAICCALEELRWKPQSYL